MSAKIFDSGVGPPFDPPPSVCAFHRHRQAHGDAAANQVLLGWLSDDRLRALLYADMVKTGCPLHFQSNASRKTPDSDGDARQLLDYDWADGPRQYQQPAVLLAHPRHVEQALKRSQPMAFSNIPYRGLGGFFMLGLDDWPEHDRQRLWADRALATLSACHLDALATLAFQAGALVPLKSARFDLPSLAEGIALRYVAMVFGFAAKDLALLEACTRKIGRGLQYQNMGRHFVLEPATMAECRQAVVALGQRATEILGLLSPGAPLSDDQQEDKDELGDEWLRLRRTRMALQACDPKSPTSVPRRDRLWDFTPLLRWMAADKGPHSQPLSLSEKGLIAAGLVGGAVTNIQNAICLVLADWLGQSATRLKDLKTLAVEHRSRYRNANLSEPHAFHAEVRQGLRRHPPAPFLPRRVVNPVTLQPSCQCKGCPSPCGQSAHVLKPGTLVLLGLGPSASEDCPAPPQPAACPFSKVFGGPTQPTDSHGGMREYPHACPGLALSMHVVDHALRQLILLPGLSETLDDQGQSQALQMRWGQQSVAYPLIYERSRLLAQTPLQTVLPIKAPVDLHSQQLRQVLRLGAPFIEKVLRDANMVHFASFMFLDGDSKLVLFTMYDGDFDAYIAHFAVEFGHLFDRFFACIAVAPRMPIREHPDEFVQYLRQFVQPPVEGYYFSAYPQATTDRIVHHFSPLAFYDEFSSSERGS